VDGIGTVNVVLEVALEGGVMQLLTVLQLLTMFV
jgi:hypothetical protein